LIVLIHLPATPRTDPKGLRLGKGRLGPAALIKNPAAAVAFQKNLPSLDREEGNKEKAQVMVQTLEASGRQATLGAGLWLVVYLNLLGLYPADEDENDTSFGVIKGRDDHPDAGNFGDLRTPFPVRQAGRQPNRMAF
jgi:hypothetical protein